MLVTWPDSIYVQARQSVRVHLERNLILLKE